MREQTFCVYTREDFAANYNHFSKSAILSAMAQSKESMMKTAGGMDIPPAVFGVLQYFL